MPPGGFVDETMRNMILASTNIQGTSALTTGVLPVLALGLIAAQQQPAQLGLRPWAPRTLRQETIW